ncbi:unnamed protein product [Owenia fusiformis]|uniref:Ubiquinone biosynthesis protein COQ4 homolog, mitochondrial n=1 Tax=Owenia fusiformis TaxID=6347 RepID=A0A8J1TZT7_OWEFU|nr:unnamed protein product [Owenia fusiformis]
MDELYDGHIPTSTFQKILLGVGSAGVAIVNPWRDDMIAVMGEATGELALKSLRAKMLADPVGRQILENEPRINSQTVDLDYLKTLPDGTFGREYRRFLDKYQLTPDARRHVEFVDDVELAYVMQRYREIHDLFHTLFGMPTNWLGEVSVKTIEGLQLGLPMCVLGAVAGPVRFYNKPKHGRKYVESYLPWAMRVGQNAKFLMNVYYEKHWEQPLIELREELNIETPPS